MTEKKLKKHPILIMMRGLPGSGKSFIARQVVERYGQINTVILDPDAIDFGSDDYAHFSEELSIQQVDSTLHPYRYLRAQAYKAIDEGKLIIWNQAFTNQELVHRTIINLQTHATEGGNGLDVLVVDVAIDPETAKERINSRVAAGGHAVNEEMFARFLNDYRSFQGYDYPYILLNGDAPVEASTTTLLEKIKNLPRRN